MACELIREPEQTVEERQKEIDEALKALELQISQGRVKIVVGRNGAVCFKGWETNRRGLTDACAFRKLQLRHSWHFKNEVAKAELAAGRKVDLNAIANGLHSHDGGLTWSSHGRS